MILVDKNPRIQLKWGPAVNSHIRVRAAAMIINKNNEILLVEYEDENGVHYNIPGGGAEPGETIIETVRREAMEEVSARVEVGDLVLVYEYEPVENHSKYGPQHSICLMFECTIPDGETAQMPEYPDSNQTDIKWISLAHLKNIILYPDIKEQILEFAWEKRSLPIIEESQLNIFES